MKFNNCFLERVLPFETRRRRLYDLSLRQSRVILNEGLNSFLINLYKYAECTLTDKINYKKKFQKIEPSAEDLERMRNDCKSFKNKPKISIILPVWNTNEKWLKQAIDSVINQVYDNWELCIVDDGSNKVYIKEILNTYSENDNRIKVKILGKNLGISGASNEALSMVTGEFTGFLDHDDLLVSSALYEVVKLLEKNPEVVDFVYSDELFMDENNRPKGAFYRPDFSLDYLLSHCYIVHFVVIRSSIIHKIKGFRNEFSVSQDYDLFLRVISETRRIRHIPKILYKWRQAKSSAGHLFESRVMDLGKKAIQDFLERENIEAEVFDGLNFNFFRVRRKIIDYPKITIIIPTKDRVDLLRQCIESIENKTIYKNYEVIVVDNRSKEIETAEYLSELQVKYDNYKVIKFDESFNYSRLNNFAAKYAKGDHLLFLNNDVEVISPGWLEALLEHSQRDEVGCVGAKLIYPDRRIQHVGVVIGFCGSAEHIYKFGNSNDIGYMGQFISIRNYSAVTAACMMIRKKVFEELNGFDKNLKVGFGDSDFCLRALEKGYLNVFTPYAELYHYESATRGKTFKGDSHPDDSLYFINRWREIINEGDPYYNPNLPKKF